MRNRRAHEAHRDHGSVKRSRGMVPRRTQVHRRADSGRHSPESEAEKEPDADYLVVLSPRRDVFRVFRDNRRCVEVEQSGNG